jgi:magnesium transporter
MRHTRLYREGVLEAKDFPAAQISDYLQEPGTVVWLDLCEPDHADLEVVSQEFGLHPLAVEDAVQQHERPKLDRFQDHYFLTAYAVSLDPATGRPPPASWPPSPPQGRSSPSAGKKRSGPMAAIRP